MASFKTPDQIELRFTLLMLEIISFGDVLSPCWYFYEQRAEHLSSTCSTNQRSIRTTSRMRSIVQDSIGAGFSCHVIETWT